jgi:hypothetical protein
LLVISISGCTSISSITCKPDWIFLVALDKDLVGNGQLEMFGIYGDIPNICKTGCYNRMQTTSFKLLVRQKQVENTTWNSTSGYHTENVTKTYYDCYCDVNKCGFNGTE